MASFTNSIDANLQIANEISTALPTAEGSDSRGAQYSSIGAMWAKHLEEQTERGQTWYTKAYDYWEVIMNVQEHKLILELE